jgi:DNA-binding response OmpR family regulator
MSKILLVDDDAFTLEAYRKKLQQLGFEVHTASDGLEAVKMLHLKTPDLLILDIMMPKLNGFEVLKYIRSHSDLEGMRVIVLSNFYSGDPAHQAAISQANVNLLKASCTPALLIETVNYVLRSATPRVVVSGPAPPPFVPATPPPPFPNAPPGSTAATSNPSAYSTAAADGPLQQFTKSARTQLAIIRQLNEAFVKSENRETQVLRLMDFYQKAQGLTVSAVSAGCDPVALVGSAFSVLLLELHHKPALITSSILQTIAHTLDMLLLLVDRLDQDPRPHTLETNVLVVDDDPISSQALATTLRKANLNPFSVRDSGTVLELVQQGSYALLLLDIQMPGLDGFELCKAVRKLESYHKVPILFVTAFSEFDNRMHSVLSGADDLISKPIFPAELALKVVNHVAISQTAVR